ncbi:MAG: hypothetical protein FJW77_03960 [Actinobacteria bacterium]|nr:hypothetical protein [Actinomycetota bacterium]
MVNDVGTRVVRMLRALAAGALVAASVAITVVPPAGALTSVDTEAELRAAFATDAEIVITSDITLTDCDADDVLRTIAGPVTLVGDFFGAGLLSNGDATLSGVTVTGNTIDATVASAVYGGGVAVAGTLVLEGSTVRGNAALSRAPGDALSAGGGIFGNGSATVSGVRFFDNGAAALEGEYAGAVGGALLVTGRLEVQDSDFTANVVGRVGARSAANGSAARSTPPGPRG